MESAFVIFPVLIGLGFVLFGLLFVGFIVFLVIVIRRNWKTAKDAGYDPLTMETQMAAQVMNSELLRPAAAPAPAALEQRLAELDDLHRRGVITDAEHVAARASALQG
ncbi:SHOCT domain-containing protein [Microbacterium sp. NPDC057650]|uniref:SHOCT domain-containing protein n=1 Tax=unclassified Microbacterium TaxID=2609290 RepID=UPI00366C8DA6